MMQSSNVAASSQDQRCGSALDAAVRSRLNLKPEILSPGFTHVVIFAFCCELVCAGDWISLTSEDIVFLATVVGAVSFHMLPLGWKGRKGCGVLSSVCDRMAGSKMSAVFIRRQGVLQCFVASGAFGNKESSKQFFFYLKDAREGARFFVFHTQSSNGWPAGCSVGQASNICAERQAHVARQ